MSMYIGAKIRLENMDSMNPPMIEKSTNKGIATAGPPTEEVF